MDDKPQQNIGKWSREEQERFEESLHMHGKNWKEVYRHVGTRSLTQVRSHAQKYFKKLNKAKQESKQAKSLDELYQDWLYHSSKASEYFYALSQFGFLRSKREDTAGPPT